MGTPPPSPPSKKNKWHQTSKKASAKSQSPRQKLYILAQLAPLSLLPILSLLLIISTVCTFYISNTFFMVHTNNTVHTGHNVYTKIQSIMLMSDQWKLIFFPPSCFPDKCVPFISKNFIKVPVFCLSSSCFQAKAKLRALQLLEERGINLAERIG